MPGEFDQDLEMEISFKSCRAISARNAGAPHDGEGKFGDTACHFRVFAAIQDQQKDEAQNQAIDNCESQNCKATENQIHPRLGKRGLSLTIVQNQRIRVRPHRLNDV